MIPKIRGWFEYLFFDQRKRAQRTHGDEESFPGVVVAECDDVYLVTAEIEDVFDVAVTITPFLVEAEQESVFAITVELEDVFGLTAEELPI